MKPIVEKIQVRDTNGKASALSYNEPRPDMDIKEIQSNVVELSNPALAHAAIRIRVEHILDHSCGEQRLTMLKDMGTVVPSILMKIARRGISCSSCGDRKNNAIKALGHFATAEALGFLTGIALDTTEDITFRANAILALGHIGAAGSVDVFRQLAKGQKSEPLVAVIVTALGMNKSVRALSVLEEVFTSQKSTRIKTQTLAALTRLEKFHLLETSYAFEKKRLLTKLSTHSTAKIKKIENPNA